MIGQQLSSLRSAKSITIRHLARKTFINRLRLGRIESGQQLPTLDEIQLIMEALDADRDVAADMLAMVRSARNLSNDVVEIASGPNGQLQNLIGMQEAAASRVRGYEPSLIPGPLQTAGYIKASLTVPPRLKEKSERSDADALAGRLARQQQLFSTDTSYEFIIGEPGLRTPMLDADGMRAQYAHIATLATLSNVSVGILPVEHIKGIRTFSFFLFDDSLASLDTAFGHFESSYPSHLADCELIWEAGVELSVWGSHAISLLHELSTSMSTTQEGVGEVLDAR